MVAYTNRFNDRAKLCLGMVTPWYKKIERYIWGLTPQIQDMVISFVPTIFDGTKRIAYQLTDQGIFQGTMVKKADPPEGRDSKKKFWDKKK